MSTAKVSELPKPSASEISGHRLTTSNREAAQRPTIREATAPVDPLEQHYRPHPPHTPEPAPLAPRSKIDPTCGYEPIPRTDFDPARGC